MGAGDVISISTFRSLLQDKARLTVDTFMPDGQTVLFELLNSPVLMGEDYSVTLFIDNIPVSEDSYTIIYDSGVILFNSPPVEGVGTIVYYTAQLTDSEIIEILDYALIRHDPTATWEEFPPEYAPYIHWLALSSAYYMLASRWATITRLKVETVETHDHQVAGRYFELGRRMEERYQEASAGIINVKELTRRDNYTGFLVPLTEEFYNEQS